MDIYIKVITFLHCLLTVESLVLPLVIVLGFSNAFFKRIRTFSLNCKRSRNCGEVPGSYASSAKCREHILGARRWLKRLAFTKFYPRFSSVVLNRRFSGWKGKEMCWWTCRLLAVAITTVNWTIHVSRVLPQNQCGRLCIAIAFNYA